MKINAVALQQPTAPENSMSLRHRLLPPHDLALSQEKLRIIEKHCPSIIH